MSDTTEPAASPEELTELFLRLENVAAEACAESMKAAMQHGVQWGLPWVRADRNTHPIASSALLQITVERHKDEGTLSWADILLEEVGEAIDEPTWEKARLELVQVAAMAISAIIAHDRRTRQDPRTLAADLDRGADR